MRIKTNIIVAQVDKINDKGPGRVGKLRGEKKIKVKKEESPQQRTERIKVYPKYKSGWGGGGVVGGGVL